MPTFALAQPPSKQRVLAAHLLVGFVLTGTLENEPRDVTTVKAGDAVEVSEADVTDVMNRFEDGTCLGDEVGRATAPESFQ